MTVKVYRSSDSGGPGEIANTVGALCTLWDALLVQGYPTRSVTSITRSGAVATVTLSAHGFSNGATRTISGAVEDEYNGNQVITVIDANTFTYAVSGTPATPATGTLLCDTVTNGLGWKAAFTGTNKRAYKMRTGTGFYLRLDHSNNAYDARVRGYETMSDVDTGTGLFPTSAQQTNGLFVKITNNAGPRAWIAMGDDRGFWFLSHPTTTDAMIAHFFGDIVPYKTGDVYNCMLIAADTDDSAQTGGRASEKPTSSFLTSTTAGHYIARSHTQSGSAVLCTKWGDMERMAASPSGGGAAGTTAMTYPDTVTGGLHVAKYIVVEPSAGPRGILRGFWEVCHLRTAMSGVSHGDVVAGSDVLLGKTFQLLDMYDGGGTLNSRVAIETSNWWDSF